ITYATNSELAFDYLRDNMATDLAQCVQRELTFAIVDEVDSILIDEARTPLIISGQGEDSTEKYVEYARYAARLKEEEDFTVDLKHKSVSLTEEGIAKMERWSHISNIYDLEHVVEAHQINQALKAKALFLRDRDYLVRDGEVVIVDEFTGRTMPGRRWSDGLHQAVEAKEGVKVQQESQTLATITFQNYFRLYRKLAGMTGTAVTEAEEFHKIYSLEVVVIPTNMPMVREDHPDVIYKTEEGKYRAVVEEIVERHETGQPVLVGTTDIAKSERIARLLEKRGVPHEVLNAKYHEREALVVENAGQHGAVTIATNMAGRGTDIKLGEGVGEVGGLHIIGTERHESRRIDNQLRGRSGRQGDPGSSRFFISLEDELMRIFGSNMERVGRLMDEETPLESKLVSRSIESAQSKVEGYNFDARRHVVEYDDVMNTQRKIIYGERRKILEGVDTRTNVLSFIHDLIADAVPNYCDNRHHELWDLAGLFEQLGAVVPLPPFDQIAEPASLGRTPEEIVESVDDMVIQAYEALEKHMTPDVLRQVERYVMLRTIDERWVAYLTHMEHLKEAIGLQGYAQKDPLVEYKNEAFRDFEQLKRDIQLEIASRMFRVQVVQEPNQGRPVAAAAPGLEGGATAPGLAGLVTATQALGGLASPGAGNGLPNGAGSAGAGAAPGGGAPGEPSGVPAGAGVPQAVGAGRAAAAVPGYAGLQARAVGAGAGPAAAVAQAGKVGRNDPCPCGSGRKYKRCHGR
ncbi:MAG TPA: SEC-C metal-binding domain-containing protein, partial [Candidatus Dormibacteraeota bacterium]|nr:SEC-C metal-binding domain-containing protein [Candidatus Dormibacteraeota bacterium]